MDRGKLYQRLGQVHAEAFAAMLQVVDEELGGPPPGGAPAVALAGRIGFLDADLPIEIGPVEIPDTNPGLDATDACVVCDGCEACAGTARKAGTDMACDDCHGTGKK